MLVAHGSQLLAHIFGITGSDLLAHGFFHLAEKFLIGHLADITHDGFGIHTHFTGILLHNDLFDHFTSQLTHLL